MISEKYGENGPSIYFDYDDESNKVLSSFEVKSPLINKKHTIYDRLKTIFKEVFLPQGFPKSVREDYSSYQFWDTVQAFCSTISGTMTTHAIMKGVGVGDSAATALSATITWIMKDGFGMMGRIAFAWWKGSGLDADCKKWRLCADFLNDAAMTLELLLLPLFPHSSTQILCITSGMKAIVGVAGGASRATITQHHAIRGNTGDVSAKDGSQETCVNLIASVFGVFILSVTEHSLLLWLLFSLVTILHLFANYKAVKSLKLTTFNSERLVLFLNTYLNTSIIQPPEVVNSLESVIVGKGYSDRNLCGFQIKMGCSFNQSLTFSNFVTRSDVKKLTLDFQSFPYILIINKKEKIIYVIFSPGETTKDVLQAFLHATLLGISLSPWQKSPNISQVANPNSIVFQLQKLPNEEHSIFIKKYVIKEAQEFIDRLKNKGWNTENHHLYLDEWRCNLHGDSQKNKNK